MKNIQSRKGRMIRHILWHENVLKKIIEGDVEGNTARGEDQGHNI